MKNIELAKDFFNQHKITEGSFTYKLAGSGNATTRQELIKLLTGTKPTKAKAGISALYKAMWELAGSPQGTCKADEEKQVFDMFLPVQKHYWEA